MGYLFHVDGLSELEKSGNYEAAWSMLHEEWTQDTTNCGLLIRLIAECWYLLAFSNSTPIIAPFDRVQAELLTCYAYGKEHFEDNPRYLSVVGYLMEMLPHFFVSKKDKRTYEMCEQLGGEMLEKAVRLDPTDLVAKVLWLGFLNLTDERAVAASQLAPHLAELFPDETEVDQYFADILSE